MVDGYTDNDDPRWVRDGFAELCFFNRECRDLKPGQEVLIYYRDTNLFDNQAVLSIIDIRVEGDEYWADLDGDPYQAPLWALIAAD
jgi:hypothetical protein